MESNPAPITPDPQPPVNTLPIADSATRAIPILIGGRRSARYQAKELLVNIHPAVSRERASNPISPSPAPTTPISRRRRTRRSARRRWVSPRLRSGGHRATDATRDTRRRHPAFLCSIPGRARSPSRFMVRGGKGRQWTERPGKTLHLPLQNGHFGNPSKKFQRPLSIGGGMAMKQK